MGNFAAKIVTVPDILLKKCRPVETFGKDLQDLIEELNRRLLEDRTAAGLAAPQIGVDARVALVRFPDSMEILINPEIYPIKVFGRELRSEGCLSLPGQEYLVSRWVNINYTTRTTFGGSVTSQAKDFYARVIQHEVDHLDGILIIHRAGVEDRR